MGYDWKGWAVVFYFFSAAFMAFGASDAASWGLTPVQHKWLLMVLGLLAGVGAKMGESWVGKTGYTRAESARADVAKPLIVLLVMSSLLGCAKPPPNLDPQTAKMFEATEVAKRINRLQGAVIDLEAERVIQTDVARTIIRFTVAANQTMLDYPSGYGPLVASAWKNLKAIKDVQNVLATHPKLAAAMQLVDVALAVWLPTQEAACFSPYSSLWASPIPG